MRAKTLQSIRVCVLIALLTAACTVCPWAEESADGGKQPAFAVIPKPVEMTVPGGSFVLDNLITIAADSRCMNEAQYLADVLRSDAGIGPAIVSGMPKKGVIALEISNNRGLTGDEGYELTVDKDGIRIAAAERAGVFYGIQTLRQLIALSLIGAEHEKGSPVTVPCIFVRDKPRFPWRGLMIDCSRTFWRKELIGRYIDVLAYYKMNVLHLHLTDDQGWRVEIKKHPELTTVGSKFAARFNELPGRQGFYSQDDIREMVAYAASRHVTIIPEIEMPGHSYAALAVYPGLSCTGEQFEIHPFFQGPGIHEDVFCAGSDRVFDLLEDVLEEVIGLFPSDYIHIGGDECPKKRWENCAKCQARMKAEGLKDEHELQSYFVKRIEKFLLSKNRKLLGWDEILEGGLAESAAVMSWRGMEGGIAAARAGHDVVMSPTSHCYFDYTYEKISTEKTYLFEPVPAGFTADETRHILGPQANMWTHIARTEPEMYAQIFPRLIALAEVGWTPKEAKKWNGFRNRLLPHCERLDALSIACFRDPSVWGE